MKYPKKFKTDVVAYADKFGDENAALQFGVLCKKIQDWRSNILLAERRSEKQQKSEEITCLAESRSTAESHREKCKTADKSPLANPNVKIQVVVLTSAPEIPLSEHIRNPASEELHPPSHGKAASVGSPSEVVVDMNEKADVVWQIPKPVENMPLLQVVGPLFQTGDRDMLVQETQRDIEFHRNVESVSSLSRSCSDSVVTDTVTSQTVSGPPLIVGGNASVDADEQKLAKYYQSIMEAALYYQEMLDICKVLLENRELPSGFPQKPKFVAYQTLFGNPAGTDGVQNFRDALNELHKSRKFVPGNKSIGTGLKILPRLLREAFVLSLDEN